MSKQKKGNVILFPHLFERYVELALVARENEDYETARVNLEQAIAIEPGDVSAMFGLVVTYHDLGLFDEARELSDRMLKEGLGDFVEVLRLYVISLIQLEKYDMVCELLTILEDDQVLSPIQLQEFKEIHRTCELLLESRQELEDQEPMICQVVQEKLETDPSYVYRLIKQLNLGDFDNQLQAIEQLKYIEQENVIDALIAYLVKDDVDPLLKTFALTALKTQGIEGMVPIQKGDQWAQIDIMDVPELEKGLSGKERLIADLIAEKTYHEDPIFSSFALQLWLEFYYAAYPFHPSFKRIEGWSAALHYATIQTLGRKASKKEVSELYGTTAATLTKCYHVLKQVLKLDARLLQHKQYLPLDSE